MSRLSSRIVYGTAWKQERTKELVIKAVRAGFRAIDTACQPKHYREDLVGDALATLEKEHAISRRDLFLQTKYTPIGGQDQAKPIPYDPSSPVSEQVVASVHTSLKNLRVSYLDCLLLHSPLPTIDLTLEAWRTLMSLQDEGKVRMIGISNTDIGNLKTICEVRKAQIVQNRWYEGNGWDKDVCRFCREHAIQYQSFWTLTGSPTLLSLPLLVELANAAKLSPAQTIFKLAHLQEIIPLSGTKSARHMEDDLAVEKFTLSTDILQRLQAISKQLQDEM